MENEAFTANTKFAINEYGVERTLEGVLGENENLKARFKVYLKFMITVHESLKFFNETIATLKEIDP